MNYLLSLVEKKIIPDPIIRFGIRQLCKQRLKEIHRYNPEKLFAKSSKFIKECHDLNKIAEATQEANQQHYELPTEFFKIVLGQHLKYSCSQFNDMTTSLTQAESKTLQLYAQRAQLNDNQKILDLGCGWGSMSLFMAQQYPNAQITAVSNSTSQKKHIESECKLRNINNITVITCDINQLSLNEKFDRIISIEMLEHVKNHKKLFANIASWLTPNGLLFIHIFSHLLAAYPFTINDESDWMAKYFFTGGVMPANHQFLYYQEQLTIQDHWVLNGSHYEKTANAWLKNLDSNTNTILKLFMPVYGKDSQLWLQRWRLFFMACAELFGYKQGNEWIVSHYLFKPRDNMAI